MESSNAYLAKRRRFFGCKAWKLRHGLRKRLVRQVCVVLCGNARVGMTEQLGDRQQIHAGLRQVRGVGVAQLMKGYHWLNLGNLAGHLEGAHMVVMPPCCAILASEYNLIACLAGEGFAKVFQPFWIERHMARFAGLRFRNVYLRGPEIHI